MERSVESQILTRELAKELINKPVDLNDGLCHEHAGHLIAGHSWYACVLPKGHEEEHRGGGCCVIHGDYVFKEQYKPGCPKCEETGYAEIFETGRKPTKEELWDGKPRFKPWNGETSKPTEYPTISPTYSETGEIVGGPKQHMTQRDYFIYKVDATIERAISFMEANTISEEEKNIITELISSINGLQEIIL